jgi:hypothetical protein
MGLTANQPLTETIEKSGNERKSLWWNKGRPAHEDDLTANHMVMHGLLQGLQSYKYDFVTFTRKVVAVGGSLFSQNVS